MMNVEVGLTTILESVAVAGIGWLMKLVYGLHKYLMDLHVRLAKSEQWQELHEKEDERRFRVLELFMNRER